MKKSVLILLAALIFFTGCKKTLQPIKWEKPGDELVGEWTWSKGIRTNQNKTIEFTDLGAFLKMPGLKAGSKVIFTHSNSAQLIFETTSILDTTRAEWSIQGDTLKLILYKNGRIDLTKYKVYGNKLIINHLDKSKEIEEYTRD